MKKNSQTEDAGPWRTAYFAGWSTGCTAWRSSQDAGILHEGWFHTAQGFAILLTKPLFTSGQHAGCLNSDDGWVLWLLDQAGSTAFGQWWPFVGWGLTACLVVSLLVLAQYGYALVIAPVQYMRSTWVYLPGCPTNPNHVFPPAVNRIRSADLHWCGPEAADGLDNDYLSQQVRGRGETRKPNHTLLRHNGCVARIAPNLDERTRIDATRLGVVMESERIQQRTFSS